MIWAGMAYQHFLGCLESPPPLFSEVVEIRYLIHNNKIWNRHSDRHVKVPIPALQALGALQLIQIGIDQLRLTPCLHAKASLSSARRVFTRWSWLHQHSLLIWSQNCKTQSLSSAILLLSN